MLDVSPGPYRNEFDAQKLRTEAISEELAETQESLALERAECKILRAENTRLRGRFGVSRFGLLFLGVFRWGLNRFSAMLAGMAIMGIVCLTGGRMRSSPEPHFRPPSRSTVAWEHHPVRRAPTMRIERFSLEHGCSLQQMCEMCWTWGGEQPRSVFAEPQSYEVEVELIIARY